MSVDRTQIQPENYLMKVSTRDQAVKLEQRPQGPDAGRYNPKPENYMSRFPCIVDLDRSGEVTRDTFIPKPQHAENPSVSCHRLHSELVALKELIRSPSKKIQDDLAALQRPKMSRESSAKATLPK